MQMNKDSSRSHLIMTICIEATNLQTQAVSRGKLSFVDLAGSERWAATFVRAPYYPSFCAVPFLLSFCFPGKSS